MTCPVNWNRYYIDMKEKNIDEATATKMMLAGATQNEKKLAITDAIHTETASPTLIQTGLGDYNTEKETIRALQDVYGTPDNMAAHSGGLLKPTDVIDHATQTDQHGLVITYLGDHPDQLGAMGAK